MNIFRILVIILFPFVVKAQHFIEKGIVEYEVKTNIQKTLGNNSWAEKLKESLPQFKTAYYALTFAENKNIYKFSHWDEKTKTPDFLKADDEEKFWFFDFGSKKFSMKKSLFGSAFLVQDSMMPIKWKLVNENRNIAGFNCRKAVGVIFDSVYVFAFYTDEITIPGGPCSINGLPGLILGMTIPRIYTSWIATKVQENDVSVDNIKPVSAKNMYTRKSLRTFLDDRLKQFNSEESKDWINQMYWSAFL